ncbi:MAG: thiolase family protein [Pseudomonadota bacterium]
MSEAYIVSASRTPVAPRNGALADLDVWQLGASVIKHALSHGGVDADKVDAVVMGNALYGGGNPARMAALEAGLPEFVSATTIDTQCCAGLDAVGFAAQMIRSGDAHVVVAGGLESYSRSPIRQSRPRNNDELPSTYERPPFTPFPDRDPDMLEAAAHLARRRDISREAQAAYAIASHQKALKYSGSTSEIVKLKELSRDAFTRNLTPAVCARASVICGDSDSGLTHATVAVEADAAATVIVVSEELKRQIDTCGRALRFSGHRTVGSDPENPALAPVAAVDALMASSGIASGKLACVELMEAFAVQSIACIDDCRFTSECVNRGGGALARGHPIGASGAILAVRLWHELQTENTGAKGIASIAAAGGLGSASLWEVVD